MSVTRDDLPACLQLTQGSDPQSYDDRCPICWDDIDDDTKTITHIGTDDSVGCKRRFCEGCLLQSINTPADSDIDGVVKCPLCRTHIFNRAEPNMMEDDEEDRADLVLERRRQRPAPAEYHAAGSPDIMTALLVRRRWNILPIDILAQVRDEMLLTDDMIDIVGLDALEENVDIFTVADICRRQIELGLNATSVQYLWVMSRLLGASLWYLAQVPCAPEVGFFIPRLPRFNVLSSVSRHVAETFYSPDHQGFPSTVIQLPVPTDVLLSNLESRNVVPVGRQTTELAALREVQADENVTNWILFDIVRDALGPLEIGVMPWPTGSVYTGFERLAYPGWNRTDILSSRNGWDLDSDNLRLMAFATTAARIFATSTESRLIRVETENRMLRHLREQEHAPGSSASSTTSNEDSVSDHDDNDEGFDDDDSNMDSGAGSFLVVDRDLQDEAVASIENEVAHSADREAAKDAEEGTDENVDVATGEETRNVEEQADQVDITNGSQIDAFEDDTFDRDNTSDSDTDTDTASEYSPSPSEGDTTLEYQQYHVSRREQDSLTQWLQDPTLDAREDDLPDAQVDEDSDFDGVVLHDRESFDRLASMLMTPSVSAPTAGRQADGVGAARLGMDTRIEPSYYEEVGAYGHGFEPEVGYASNAIAFDMDMKDLCGIFEEDYDADRMDTTAG